ncbi:NlpC/P60 family protein [Pseudobacteroides cellulosolvens]|uniref:NLP/P60 protein n=1 Tax=Pseudobacteroides cellulosolvens ATCC 35603 = DSM 2933 TaxID=398512 RepID=A0A0L6JVD3_9FIRM|nr:NlpC/P60 family protein [Pseudobacteroides cellulosolvens]KNY29811.1 NLP/P60 protein [Pseudobacteroides cellulosolvens ATCC 35603 = DSM 2933]
MGKKVILTILMTLIIFGGCSNKEKEENAGASFSGAFTTSASWNNIGVITDTVVDLFKESTVQADKVTQVLYNQPVNIIETKESWSKVETGDGLKGWVKTRYITKDTSSLDQDNSESRIIVTVKKSSVLSQIANGSLIEDVVMGTEFSVIKSVQDWYEVALPNEKTGWISENGTIHIEAGKKVAKTSAESFVATALKFKGTVFLQGGISAWGIDSSGLTYICSRINGVKLPRSIQMQYKMGKAIDITKEKPAAGDLVFFSLDEQRKDLATVGIFVNTSEFLIASKLGYSVTISSREEEYFKQRIVGVRRIF